MKKRRYQRSIHFWTGKSQIRQEQISIVFLVVIPPVLLPGDFFMNPAALLLSSSLASHTSTVKAILGNAKYSFGMFYTIQFILSDTAKS